MRRKQLQTYLQRLSIEQLNPMQQDFLEAAQSAQDLLLLSPTGSGKTLAFLLGLLERLPEEPTPKVWAMIVTPARELALQITQVFRQLKTGYKVTCCYGGHPFDIERNELIEPPVLLVGTPGRLLDHFRQETVDPSAIQYLVLDEFDKSLELGFEKEMRALLEALPALQHHWLTSATQAIDLPDFLPQGQLRTLDHSRPDHAPATGLRLCALLTHSSQRQADFLRLVQYVGHKSTLIFCNQKATVERVSEWLDELRIEHGTFHGDLEQDDRELALLRFRNQTHRILIATDLAARGLDIPHLQHIIHYQLPHSEAEFIHRNGRTARMEATGTAYVLLEEDQPWRPYLDDQLEYIELPKSLPQLPPSQWQTLYISAGKKDKINKFDLVGALLKKGGLQPEELGLVVVKAKRSYAAVRRNKVDQVIERLHKRKIKKQKVVVAVAW